MSEVSHREGEILYDISYMWNLKRNDTNKLTNRNRLTDLENNLMVAGRDSQEFGKVMYTVLYSKSITNKDLL